MRTILKGIVRVEHQGRFLEKRQLYLELLDTALPPGVPVHLGRRLVQPERVYFDPQENAIIHEFKFTMSKQEADQCPYLTTIEHWPLPY